MPSDERLIARIRAVNPIGHDDETGLLTAGRLASALGSSGHVGAERTVLPPVTPSDLHPRMGIIVAAATFVAVLVGSSVIALLTTSGDTADIADMSAPTTRSALANIPLSGAVGDSAAVEAFAAVEDAYRLYNSGDAAGWVEVRDRGSFYESASMRQQILLPVIERTRLEIEANTRYEVIGCSSQGFGEWPRVTDEGIPVAVGYLFTCDAAVISDSPVYEGTESFNWVSSGGMVVAVNSSFSPTATPMRSTHELGE